jgi:hypothetical protein
MSTSDAILEQWIARTVESYPRQSTPFLTSEEDRFRNPLGYTLRGGLATLLQQLLGDMDKDCIAPALNAIVRIRALQDFSASEAVGFVFLLKPILREYRSDADLPSLDRRIDQLALLAFDNYARCREQLAEIRVNESKRAMWARHGVG